MLRTERQATSGVYILSSEDPKWPSQTPFDIFCRISLSMFTFLGMDHEAEEKKND